MSAAVDHARDLGHAAATACADSESEGFREDALEAIKDYAKRGKSFTAEDVRAANPHLNPDDSRAWGGVFLGAKRSGYIVAAGAVPVASSRGGFKTLWRAP